MEDLSRTVLHDFRLASRKAEESDLRRYQASAWLESFIGVRLSTQPSEQEFVSCLRNGLLLCNLINKIEPGTVTKVIDISENQPLPAYQYFENVRNFLVAVEGLNLTAFEASDLEKDSVDAGSTAKIVDCILSLKSYHEWKQWSDGSGGSGLSGLSGSAKYLKPISMEELRADKVSANVSHIKRSFHTIGQLITPSDKGYHQHPVVALSKTNIYDKSPSITASARTQRRQSLTGGQASGLCRRHSIGGKSTKSCELSFSYLHYSPELDCRQKRAFSQTNDSGKRSPAPRRRSPAPRRRSPAPRRRSPAPRRWSPAPRRWSPAPRRWSPAPRRRSPAPRRRSPAPRRRSVSRSPVFRRRSVSRSPAPRRGSVSRSPAPRRWSVSRSPAPRRRRHNSQSRSPESRRFQKKCMRKGMGRCKNCMDQKHRAYECPDLVNSILKEEQLHEDIGIIIEDLPYSTKLADLFVYLLEAGQIKNLIVMEDKERNRSCNGTAIVFYTLLEEAKRALEKFNKIGYGNATIKLSFLKDWKARHGM